MKRSIVIASIAVALSIIPTTASAQAEDNDYGIRISSRDGLWIAPAATTLLGSDDDDHVGRGSINSFDWSASVGTPVFAARAGVVGVAGCYLYENGKHFRAQGYGCFVEIEHGNGIVSQYGHCAEGSIRVTKGNQVDQWTQLCNIGMTGVTSFAHTHFTILVNGSPIRIDSVFDKSKLRRCHLCSGSNDPMQPILKDSGSQPVAQWVQEAKAPEIENTIATRRSVPMLAAAFYKLGAMPSAILGIFILAALILLFFCGKTVRSIALTSTAVFLMVGLVMESEISSGEVVAHGQAEHVVADLVGLGMTERDAFEIAYDFLNQPGVEGHSCTNDGAYTKAGVTQGAYNRFRQRHGLPTADVCQSLSETERKAIAYEDFWIKSGSHKLPFPLNWVHFDFSFNAGSEPGGPPSQILSQSGGDPMTYNQLRIEWYKNRSACPKYCTGWINRVNKLQAKIQ